MDNLNEPIIEHAFACERCKEYEKVLRDIVTCFKKEGINTFYTAENGVVTIDSIENLLKK